MGHRPALDVLDILRDEGVDRVFGVDAIRAESADHLRELVAAGELTGPLLVDVPPWP
jgi:hypothetical protein